MLWQEVPFGQGPGSRKHSLTSCSQVWPSKPGGQRHWIWGYVARHTPPLAQGLAEQKSRSWHCSPVHPGSQEHRGRPEGWTWQRPRLEQRAGGQSSSRWVWHRSPVKPEPQVQEKWGAGGEVALGALAGVGSRAWQLPPFSQSWLSRQGSGNWQVSPRNPGAHWQISCPRGSLRQVPPLAQGPGEAPHRRSLVRATEKLGSRSSRGSRASSSDWVRIPEHLSLRQGPSEPCGQARPPPLPPPPLLPPGPAARLSLSCFLSHTMSWTPY